MQINWLPNPAESDYSSALNYLTLICDQDDANKALKKLRDEGNQTRRAIDILRASKLLRTSNIELMAAKDPTVHRDELMAKLNQPLPPVLIVRYQGRTIVADGYHRLVAAYLLSPKTDVACRLVGIK